jgi:hypothetical protein
VLPMCPESGVTLLSGRAQVHSGHPHNRNCACSAGGASEKLKCDTSYNFRGPEGREHRTLPRELHRIPI